MTAVTNVQALPEKHWLKTINFPRLSYDLIKPVVQAIEAEHILSPQSKTVTDDHSDYQLYMVWGFFPY